VTIVALHASERVARRAIDAAFAELDLIEEVMSLYRPDSQLCRLNREGRLDRPHVYLVEVLTAANRVAAQTGGAFDVTVQPLWQLYARSQAERRLPDPQDIARERCKVDHRRLVVGPQRITLLEEEMAVTLNGIAQGFAADRAAAVLNGLGIEHALVDAGEIHPLGTRAAGEPWQVGIQHPREPDAFAALVRLDGRALSTSGDYATCFSPDRRHHHILDPRTGVSPGAFSSVSVLAPTAIEADALSTAMFVLGLDRGRALIEATPRVDALFILKDQRTLATRGFPQHA
jgi:thiamine biosynthesis lipoprotein